MIMACASIVSQTCWLCDFGKLIIHQVFFVFFSGGKLWWADDDLAQLGTVAKRDGRNPVVLRNKTSGLVHMKVYDRDGQKGVSH